MEDGVKGRHEMVQATLEAQEVIWGVPLRGIFLISGSTVLRKATK